MRRFFQGICLGILLTLVLLSLPGLASGIKKSIDVYFNDSQVYVNNNPIKTDSLTYNGTLYVPLRQVSEMLNKDVYYDAKIKIANIKDRVQASIDIESKNWGINGVAVGSTKDDIINSLGLPDRVDPSIHGFTWYIYNKDYEKYVQAGIKDDKVVAVFSNIGEWKLENSICIGTEKDVVNRKLGSSLPTLTEDNIIYSITNNNEIGLYNFSRDLYSYIFFDIHNNETVTAIMIWDKTLPFNDIYVGKYKELDITSWQKSMDMQMFDLTNTLRVRMGYKSFEWDDVTSSVAYTHSYDMSNKDYFNHENLEGKSPFDRMKENGIEFSSASENIAMGQRNSIFAVHGLMNSASHRDNILGDFTKMGVGVHFDVGKARAYYTQNFYTP